VADPDGVFGVAQWFPGAGNDVALGPSERVFLQAYGNSAGTEPDYPAVQAAAAAMIAVCCARLAGGTSRNGLWGAAANLDTTTVFGGFRIDPGRGIQVRHQSVLVRWTAGEPRRIC
jgi:hypothetical protein